MTIIAGARRIFRRGALLCLAFAVPVSAAEAQSDWRKTWADVQARASGQNLALAVHPVVANAAVAEAFQKRFPKIRVQVSQISENRFAPRNLRLGFLDRPHG